jgi:hypothetical protein
VADEHRLLRVDIVQQADKVAGKGVDVVIPDGLGSAGAAVTALIRDQHVVAGLGDNRDLVSP